MTMTCLSNEPHFAVAVPFTNVFLLVFVVVLLLDLQPLPHSYGGK